MKRTGFVLIAELAVHDKKAADRTFLEFLPVILRESSDEQNFVKKALNWALRQIGKRNATLNPAAIKICGETHCQVSGCLVGLVSSASGTNSGRTVFLAGLAGCQVGKATVRAYTRDSKAA